MEDNTIKLEVVGLSNSLSESGAYTLVLGCKEKDIHLPIIIGNFEAQAIAMELEKIRAGRPLTHDLMKNIMDTFGIALENVLIESFVEGIFYVKMRLTDGQVTHDIDARASDSVALAVKFNKPIFASQEVIEQAGIIMQQHDNKEKEDNVNRNMGEYTMEELEGFLEIAIEQEDYEQATVIRDEILQRKSKRVK